MTIVREAEYTLVPVTLDEDELDEEIEEQEMSGGVPGVVEAIISSYLVNFVYSNNLGWVFGADTEFTAPGFKKKAKGKIKFGIKEQGRKQPDAAFVSIKRLPAVPRGSVPMAPDLAVEVFSKTDSTYDMADKVKEYLTAGVILVWVVNPADHTIAVYQPAADKPVILGVSDELDGGEVLPGFRLKLSDIFGRVIEAADDEESDG